jgi:hypothetical protein
MGSDHFWQNARGELGGVMNYAGEKEVDFGETKNV